MMTALAHRKVLVLNKLWTAVGVATVQRAITLLFQVHQTGEHAGQPKARIIDPALDFQTFTWEDWSLLRPKEGEDVIRGIGANFRIPEIVMLTQYDKLPAQRVHFSRRTIYRRDNFTCQYCGHKVGTEGTIDHIMPRAQGGETTWENCVLACVTCNSQKANRTPEKAIRTKKDVDWKGPSPMKLLSVPKKPKFALLKGDRGTVPKSWTHFISEAYWNVELENNNKD